MSKRSTSTVKTNKSDKSDKSDKSVKLDKSSKTVKITKKQQLTSKEADEILSTTDDEDLTTIFDDSLDEEYELCSICATHPRNYTCPACKCMMCDYCLKEYILKYSNQTPHCMQCQAALPFMVMCHALGKRGIKQFFTRASEIRFELEKQLIPDCLACCDELNTLSKIGDLPQQVQNILIDCSKSNNVSINTLSNLTNEAMKIHDDLMNNLDNLAFEYRLNLLKCMKDTMDKVRNEKSLHPNHNDSGNDTNTNLGSVNKQVKPSKQPVIKATKLTKNNNKAFKGNIQSFSNDRDKYACDSQVWWNIRLPVSLYTANTYNGYNHYVNYNDYNLPWIRNFTKEMKKRLEQEYSKITDIPFEKFEALGSGNITQTTPEGIIMKYEKKDKNLEAGKSKKSEYMFRCSNENCKGFVNSDFICELCHKHYCQKCFELLKDSDDTSSHVCKPEDIATAEQMLKDTKPCPNCAARIFKISGCSQMFCTNCHIGFDWNTGKIIKSEFHNPHRMEWIQSRLRAGESMPQMTEDDLFDNMENGNICGGIDTVIRNAPKAYQYALYDFRLNQIRHIRSVCITKWREELNKVGKYDYRNRCLYVLNLLTEEEYKQYLEQSVHDKYKYEMILKIYTDFVDLISQIMYIAATKMRDFINHYKKITSDNNEGMEINDLWDEIIFHEKENDIIKLCYEAEEKKYNLDALRSNLTKISKNMGNKFRNLSVGKFIEVFKAVPVIDKEFELMNEITQETINSIKTYKRMFNISTITTPINRDPSKPYQYYSTK